MLELRRRYGSSAGGGQPSRLPAGYQEVEYLESTGEQYIILPYYYLSTRDTIEFKLDFSRVANWDTPFGYYGADNSGRAKYFRFQNYDGFLMALYGGTLETETPYSFCDFGVKEAKFEAGKGLVIDGKLYGGFGDATIGSADNTPILFGYRIIGELTTNGEIRPKPAIIYHYRHIRDGRKVLDLIPCRRLSDNEKGMYDIVNDVFRTNAGTGEFLVGPDVGGGQSSILPQEYQLVDWLEATDKQYINTNINARGDLRVQVTFALTQLELPSWLFGSRRSYYTDNYGVMLLSDDGGSSSRFAYGTNSPTQARIIGDLDFHTIETDNKLVLDGIEKTSYTEQAFEGLPILLFGFNNGGNVVTVSYVKCRYFSISIGEVLLLELYPCYRKADNVAGMYDIVNNVFHTNAGTGEFTVGPDVIG